jgi:4-amino-4-deoxy-L-arabinose transferase-like glycosyltransferase
MPVVALLAAREPRDEVDRTSTRRFLVLLCLAVVLVRATFVPRPLRNDEGGYLFLARHWHTGGEFLYGDWFVDRPPLLLLIFKVASLTAWDQAIRVLAIPFVLGFVLAGWRAGSLLGGRTGGRWAALVAAGLICSPGLAADQADGELYGAVLVMAALALALSAWHARVLAHRLWLAGAAGAAAVAAPLVKQSLLEGLLFLAVLVVLGHRGPDEADRRRARTLAPAAVLGALLPCAGLALWIRLAEIEPGEAWRDLVGFRGAALEAIEHSASGPWASRGPLLLALGLVTGLFPAVAGWFLGGRRSLPRRSPERAGITVLLVFGVAAIAAAGSWWPPYLLQLAPAAVLAVGASAPSLSPAGAWSRASARMVGAAAVVGTVASIVVHATVPSAWYSQRMGEFLASSSQAGDTAFVAYGLPSVLESADMTSPYPYVWSLPLRTLDPDLTRLRRTLAGPEAPAWIVQVTGLNDWHIDDGSRLRDLVHDRYRVVAEVCGHPIWLRQGLIRELPPAPPC